ncbi:bifunctional 3-(3-hydroxy-phenyl)propionate/3-hydroxycinnamic acid hydroxylase [Sphingomonas sp. HITSZ_GF]|uniref:bifunctional 3-(3-hydroxy-phenyl)propionate/3-hydroxycinnamic acid hydroxylase n=1 Tax=Sphingomonas sp. HITSZ_GF TaxID=3037247 RepID=UPI00240D3A73|nr:bifunctional 3-(3-hydroxy-phenyl)propionate/3-hydroxycinnamic acid hydroxylase [Sphingomonas sp. HITSZ_GF]MDG2535175.1 bifunctional 3-(3-hydroxy-phenyl)propionate/3-hydroxycinnamic acid hydroxylase [Sphingomonas sp. HITSZ_GF]
MSARAEVVVIGLGPVGAVLSCLLGQAGLRVLAVERSHEVYPLPRAAHFDHEIMRVFQSVGIADEALNHAEPAGAYEFRNAAGDLLMDARLDAQGLSGWAGSYMFNQPGIERALRARLAAMPNVEVRLGDAFQSYVQHADHVEVTLAGGDVVTARYLVGCDGARSAVREAMGVALDDYQFDEPWLVVDTIPVDPETVPKVNLQICDPARPTTCVRMGPGRHRWEFMLAPDETAEQAMAPGFLEALLEPWKAKVEIERKAVYRFHGLVAKQWRDGRVLLAGDSAHQTPPFAGQGMCSGIRDAVNLAWKLDAILGRGADDALLASYQTEREPCTRSYIELAIHMGRIVCSRDPQVCAQRDAMMMAALAAGAALPLPPPHGPGREGGVFVAGDVAAGTIFPQFLAEDGGRMDDALGAGAWLIGGETGNGLTGFALDDVRLAPFRAAIEAWLFERGAEAVLVRPDRYVFGAGDADALAAAWHQRVAGEACPA